MTETLHISRKDLTSGEIIRELEAGKRVIIEVEVLGATMKMSLRRRKGTYYCDTPVKLLTYDTEDEMRRCLERYRLARPEPADVTTEETTESVGNEGP
ncbi:hypothetical protein ACYJ1Y_14575 [Natrialbaceae archaeon A-gly3]